MDLSNVRLRLTKNGYLAFGKNSFFHREIWKNAHGDIPIGYDIHHKDGDKLNNSLENLECLPHAEHLSLHMKANKSLHAWHKTEEGRKFLGEKSKKLWKERPFHSLSCLHCLKEFKAKQKDRAKYCSNNCEQAARRARGDDLIERTCVICSNLFTVNRYYKTQTCGYSCGAKLAHKPKKII